MDRKGMNILSIAAIIVTIVLIAGFITLLVLFNSGKIDNDQMVVFGSFLSFTLTTVIIVYAALTMSYRSTDQRYMEYVKKKECDDEEPETDGGPTSDGSDETGKSE